MASTKSLSRESILANISRQKELSAKALGITVEEFDQRIERRKKEAALKKEQKRKESYQKQVDAALAKRASAAGMTVEEYLEYRRQKKLQAPKNRAEYAKNYRRSHQYGILKEKGKIDCTLEEYCARLDEKEEMRRQSSSMSPEEYQKFQKEIRLQNSRKRYYAKHRDSIGCTFEEYCARLESKPAKLSPEEKAARRKTYIRKRAYERLKSALSCTFEEYCADLDARKQERSRMSLEECKEAKAMKIRRYGRMKTYNSHPEKYAGMTFEEYNYLAEEAYMKRRLDSIQPE